MRTRPRYYSTRFSLPNFSNVPSMTFNVMLSAARSYVPEFS